MKKISQLLSRLRKHLFTTAATSKRAFPPATLKAIEAAIAAGENLHRAELRLIIEPALTLDAILHNTTSRQRAIELFTQDRVWDTEENCGVLVYIDLADHKVEIVADRGVSHLVAAHEWQAICKTMTQGFANKAYHDSTIAALSQLNVLLQTHYPANGERSNQLSNQPLVL